MFLTIPSLIFYSLCMFAAGFFFAVGTYHLWRSLRRRSTRVITPAEHRAIIERLARIRNNVHLS